MFPVVDATWALDRAAGVRWSVRRQSSRRSLSVRQNPPHPRTPRMTQHHIARGAEREREDDDVIVWFPWRPATCSRGAQWRCFNHRFSSTVTSHSRERERESGRERSHFTDWREWVDVRRQCGSAERLWSIIDYGRDPGSHPESLLDFRKSTRRR